MPYLAKAVANFLLDLAERERKPLDPMSLQKLIFFAHGWHLAVRDEPLISERVEAWQFGPVIPSIYHEFKHCGRQKITGRATEIDWEGTVSFKEPRIGDSREDEAVKELIRRVWDVYKRYTAVELSNMTHVPGSPWNLVWQASPGGRNNGIGNELIKTYFKNIAAQNHAAAQHQHT